MKVLVAGGSGFLGRNTILHVLRGADVWATSFRSTDFEDFLAAERPECSVQVVSLDMRDPVAVKDALGATPREFDVCFYMMGNSDIALSRASPILDLDDNVRALLNLLENVSIGRFIFISSGAVYEGQSGEVSAELPLQPTVPYAISKLTSEYFIRYHQEIRGTIAEYTIIRFFGAYGPMEPSRKIFTNLVHTFGRDRTEEFRLRGDGGNMIDAMYVTDMMRALAAVMNDDKSNLVVDLCRGETMTLNDLVTRAASVFGITPRLVYEGETGEYTTFHASTAGMRSMFGFDPEITLEDGMERFGRFLLAEPPAARAT